MNVTEYDLDVLQTRRDEVRREVAGLRRGGELTVGRSGWPVRVRDSVDALLVRLGEGAVERRRVRMERLDDRRSSPGGWPTQATRKPG
jgi:hypothetical protein